MLLTWLQYISTLWNLFLKKKKLAESSFIFEKIAERTYAADKHGEKWGLSRVKTNAWIKQTNNITLKMKRTGWKQAG